MSSHRLALVMLIAALGPAAASAQSSPAPVASPAAGYHHKHRHVSFNRALRDLTLTPAQQQQIDGFRAAEQTANMNADQPTKEANARKMHEQIIGVLTPDQKAQLEAALHPNRMKPGAMPMPSPSPM